MKEIYQMIIATSPEVNLKLRENLGKELQNYGKVLNNSDLEKLGIQIIKNREIAERVLHLGFSEKAFLESLSGIVRIEKFKIKGAVK